MLRLELIVLLIFKITKNYIILFFKIIRKKQLSKINLSFACEHNVNESYGKVTTHYGIVCLNSKYVCFFVFMSNKFFNFFRSMLNSKIIEINNFIVFTILSNPMCTNICIFVKIYYICSILYFLGKLYLE